MTAIAISGFKTDGYMFKFYDFLEKRLDLHSLSRAELNWNLPLVSGSALAFDSGLFSCLYILTYPDCA